jgi:anionic cell wall polymer biosynthesis LytR-Cps2A-Psr (LCP) family protein
MMQNYSQRNNDQPEPPPKRGVRLSRRMIVVLAVIAVVMLICCSAGIVTAYSLLNRPLGPALALPTETPASMPVSTQSPAPAAGPTATPAPARAPTGTSMPEQQPAVTCGQSGAINILILGVDSPVPAAPRGPLAIRMVKVDFSRKTAAVFTFPRDVLVTVSGLEGLGIIQSRLGQAYLSATTMGGYTETGAINLLAQALSGSFGAQADHYVMVKLPNAALAIDTLGGLDVEIPLGYDGRVFGLPVYPAGVHHMTGSQALAYGMAPSSPELWNSIARQDRVLKALRTKILSPGILPIIPSLVTQLFQTVTTDFSPQQILDLACVAQEIPAEQIAYAEVEPGDVTTSADGALIPNGDAIRRKAEQYLGK